MKTKALGLIFAFMLLVAAAPVVHAASLTSDQINAIVGLLESFGADPATIASVEAALTGTAPATPSCVSLSYNMGAGATDAATAGQVSLLQSFLGIAPTTGYFGPTTESAVESYQASHGIVSSGSPDTTGYGFVGPQTRASMGCGGTSAPVPSPLPTGTASATIDPSSLLQAGTTGSITLSGSYSGTSAVMVTVWTAGSAPMVEYSVGNGSLNLQESNGRWSTTLVNDAGGSALPAGSYTVKIYDNSNGWNSTNSQILATGTLTVSSAAGGSNYSEPQLSVKYGADASNGLGVTFGVLQSGCTGTDSFTLSFGDGTQASVTPAPADDCFESVPHDYSAPGFYTAYLGYKGGQDDENVYVPQSAPSAPSAGIDLSSLVTSSSMPTITGTAANVPYVELTIVSATPNAPDVYQSPIVPVSPSTFGVWSISVSTALPAGTYPVELYGYGDANGTSQNAYGLLVTDTLIVSGTSQTAGINPTTLTTTNPNPTITGSATGVSWVRVSLEGSGSYGTQLVSAPVTSGNWSATFSNATLPGGGNLPPGTYSVDVYASDGNGAENALLSSGILTVKSAAAPSCTITTAITSANGGNETFSWTSTNATSLAFTYLGNVSNPASGHIGWNVVTPMTLKGTATGPGGTATCSATALPPASTQLPYLGASVAGPTTLSVNQASSYTASAHNNDVGLSEIDFYVSPTATRSWTKLGSHSCSSSSTTCSAAQSWTPSTPGTYYMDVNVLTPPISGTGDVVKCTGNPFPGGNGTSWNLCGSGSVMTVTVPAQMHL